VLLEQKETLDQNGIDGIKAVTTGKGDAGINGDGINGTTGAKRRHWIRRYWCNWVLLERRLWIKCVDGATGTTGAKEKLEQMVLAGTVPWSKRRCWNKWC
jgi:hypothetical protein